tara:strand:+ start:6756 stop:7994 length:1239 start_codon:yes stop_codon:yes gene_type:complete
MSVWPLLFGICMLTTSNGLQGTLLGLRAEFEGFPVTMIGVIMSTYYAGYLVACHYVPRLVSSVGHIRVFAALASIASTSVLLHGIFINPIAWIPIRLLSGFCFCGLFIITESWLNQTTKKKHRGTVFSAYIAIVNIGLFAGQFMINLAPLDSTYLFILVSVLISIALAPITLTNKPAPKYKKTEGIAFKAMLLQFPLPMAGVFVSGLCSSTILGLGPVYASMVGLDKPNIATLMGIYILGTAFVPLLLGTFTDKMDRRLVIEAACIVGIGCCLWMFFYGYFYVLMFILGGIITSLYSVSITFLNDQIKRSQIIAASRSLILFNAIGATIGPLIGGGLLYYIGPSSLFSLCLAALIGMLILARYRSIVGKTIKPKNDYVTVPAYSAPSVMRLQPEMPAIGEAPPDENKEDKTP